LSSRAEGVFIPQDGAISENLSTTSSVHPRDEGQDANVAPAAWRMRKTGEFTGTSTTESLFSSASVSEHVGDGTASETYSIGTSLRNQDANSEIKMNFAAAIDLGSTASRSIMDPAESTTSPAGSIMDHDDTDGFDLDPDDFDSMDDDDFATIGEEALTIDLEPIPLSQLKGTFTGAELVADAAVSLILNSLDVDDDDEAIAVADGSASISIPSNPNLHRPGPYDNMHNRNSLDNDRSSAIPSNPNLHWPGPYDNMHNRNILDNDRSSAIPSWPGPYDNMHNFNSLGDDRSSAIGVSEVYSSGNGRRTSLPFKPYLHRPGPYDNMHNFNNLYDNRSSAMVVPEVYSSGNHGRRTSLPSKPYLHRPGPYDNIHNFNNLNDDRSSAIGIDVSASSGNGSTTISACDHYLHRPGPYNTTFNSLNDDHGSAIGIGVSGAYSSGNGSGSAIPPNGPDLHSPLRRPELSTMKIRDGDNVLNVVL